LESNILFNINYLLASILITEIAIATLLLLSIGIIRTRLAAKAKKNLEELHKISDLIIKSLTEEQYLSPTPNFNLSETGAHNLLLHEMIAFSRRFNGEQWNNLCRDISQFYLLPRARMWVKSKNWLHRNYAARCFALSPLAEDKLNIIKLIDDPVFLVASIAATAGMHFESKNIIDKIIHKMTYEPGYAHYFYRDLILQHQTLSCLKLIENLSTESLDPAIRLACQSILTANPLVETSMMSQDLSQNTGSG